jgi:BirA family transcriptional regulator, biotin operon repressor / biotin---[acetyl-CoA-carboxylase] ligase
MANDLQWSGAGDPGRRLGRTVEFHASIGSTNDRVWELLRKGDVGTAVVADLQTAGRGRRGRSWTSPSGVNLMVSVGIRPRIAAADAWQLGAATALAVLEACRSALPRSLRDELGLKWPNDVVEERGRKLAGLLLETAITDDRVSEAVLGVGMNVNWRRAEMPAELVDRATSLIELGGGAIDRVALLSAYLGALDEEVTRLEDGSSPLERYRADSWLTGREVSVSAGERLAQGRVRGIAGDGSLELETQAGFAAIGFGEVVHVDVDSTPVLSA